MTNATATLAQLLGQPEVVTLPSLEGSGLTVTLDRPDVIQMIKGDGTIVDVLTPIVERFIGGDSTATNARDGMALFMELVTIAPQLEPVVNQIVVAAVASHTLSTDSSSKAYVGRLPIRDRLFIVNWVVTEEIGDISRFLAKPQGRMGAIPTVQEPTAAPVTTAGSKG